jgi:hypothetical protein
MGLTSSKLPVLQLLNLLQNCNVVGLRQYRFAGGPKTFVVTFHVRVAELLHVLPQELERSSES